MKYLRLLAFTFAILLLIVAVVWVYNIDVNQGSWYNLVPLGLIFIAMALARFSRYIILVKLVRRGNSSLSE